ncbi:hypothetical protein [Thalassobacillus devorans]|uniref:hypothetical protein n=1 Tax=Thalassobacillus devorans TaxID=279813 RepID=UPI000A1CA2C6|nr:hypothetical protein [Thalassobacillus devorans]
MNEFVRLILIVFILGFQYFLSSRNNFYWGGLIPVAFVITMAYFIIAGNSGMLSSLLITLVGLLFLVGEWKKGRKDLQKKREKELNKMRTQDI